MSNTIEDHGCSDDDPCNHPLKPYISFGCVVFPVFIVVWYHYSKQEYCRNFGRDDDSRCRDSDFEQMEGIPYNTYPQSRDGLDCMSTSELANRFVKWINRRNVYAREEKYHIEIRTMKTTTVGRTNQCKQRIVDTKSSSSSSNNNSNKTGVARKADDKSGYSRDCFGDDFGFGDDDGDDDSSSLFWECLPNIDRDPFELCSTEHTLRNRDNHPNPTKDALDNSVSIVLTDSSDNNKPVVPNGNDDDNNNNNT